MRKIVLSGVAALGLMALGLPAIDHPAASRAADAHGTGAETGVTRRGSLMAEVAAGYEGRAQSLLVADAADGGSDVRPVAVATNLVPPHDTSNA